MGHDIMINILFCSTIIDLQNEIFNITYTVYHTGVNLQILCEIWKKNEWGNLT